MPMHDWTRVKAGTFHNFHVLWTSTLTNRLNTGLLPPGFFAMAEQIVGLPEADVVTLQAVVAPESQHGGLGVVIARPKTTFVIPVEAERYTRKANRIAVRHELGDVVAVIEVVSPGNKDGKHAFRTFLEKAADLVRQGVNLLIVDPFPPGPRDPQGVHKAIWDEFTDQPFELPPGKPLTLVSYQAAPTKTAYVEPIAVGDRLPDMPLFLCGEFFVNVPLEETYQTTWDALPAALRNPLEPPPAS
jgi:hypothetical protein